MFEFHGWIQLRVKENDEEDYSQTLLRSEQALAQVRAQIKNIGNDRLFLDARYAGNGMMVLVTHGLRNHPNHGVLGLFRWVAENLPDSYGLLYIHDEWNADHHNDFRVWRLALGCLTEHADPFLSPYFPTVELPLHEPT